MCLAGHAVVAKMISEGVDTTQERINTDPETEARRWLDLTSSEADSLFFGTWTPFFTTKGSMISVFGEDGKRDALIELDYILETGRI